VPYVNKYLRICGRVRVSGGSRLATRTAPTLHPPPGASLGSLCSLFSLIHTPTPACGVAVGLAPALVHSRGRVTPGVAGQAAVLSFSQPSRGSHLEILKSFWARVQPRGMRPDAGFDGIWKAVSDGHGPADECLRMETPVASAIEDLPVDDVAREDVKPQPGSPKRKRSG